MKKLTETKPAITNPQMLLVQSHVSKALSAIRRQDEVSANEKEALQQLYSGREMPEEIVQRVAALTRSNSVWVPLYSLLATAEQLVKVHGPEA